MRQPLTGKESELLFWAVAEIADRPDRIPTEPGDPLKVLLDAGLTRDAIMAGAASIEDIAHGDFIEDPLTDIQRTILRVCVENSSWLKPQDQFGGDQSAAKKTLRELSKKLELFGIEVNHIPNN